MPWVVGIDEAGYGPNLGPLVQAAVGLYLPDDDPAGWETLKPVVRRCHEKDDRRLLIDDSKKVYTRHGLEGLERSLWPLTAPDPYTLSELLWGLEEPPAWGKELCNEAWFDPDDVLPLQLDHTAGWQAAGPVRAAIGERWYGDFRLVPAPRFNRICDESGSKGSVLARGLVEVLAGMYGRLSDPAPLIVHCDKLGGRNYYAAMVQQAFPDGWVVPELESAAESRYRVDRLDRPVTVIFRPRADAESVAVALASMLCKYLREVCMRQFNRFWAKHVPGIKPTAGYPGDSKRFFEQIRPAMTTLGLSEDQVWRKK
jgi:ribonuclease HII